MNAILKITDASGRSWEVNLLPDTIYNIGRAKENDIVLNDRRVSRRHAHLVAEASSCKIIDGYLENGEIQRSVNRVFVNNVPQFEKTLEQGDRIIIGESNLDFKKTGTPEILETPPKAKKSSASNALIGETEIAPTGVNYDDQPLGHTQLQISAHEIIGHRSSIT
ncbi:MAG: FHA domain-containing protein, partial [Acidobacteria bacterium]|nr:FHA domain-containing protein [Acidobacteriota bacterium]